MTDQEISSGQTGLSLIDPNGEEFDSANTSHFQRYLLNKLEWGQLKFVGYISVESRKKFVVLFEVGTGHIDQLNSQCYCENPNVRFGDKKEDVLGGGTVTRKNGANAFYDSSSIERKFGRDKPANPDEAAALLESLKEKLRPLIRAMFPN